VPNKKRGSAATFDLVRRTRGEATLYITWWPRDKTEDPSTEALDVSGSSFADAVEYARTYLEDKFGERVQWTRLQDERGTGWGEIQSIPQVARA